MPIFAKNILFPMTNQNYELYHATKGGDKYMHCQEYVSIGKGYGCKEERMH